MVSKALFVNVPSMFTRAAGIDFEFLFITEIQSNESEALLQEYVNKMENDLEMGIY